jgi:molecular chaperone HtpG
MVTDTIEVATRSAVGDGQGDSATGPAAEAVRWTGHADGVYEIKAETSDTGDWGQELGRPEGFDAGTTVTLHPRPGAEDWLTQVAELARSYGHLLDIDITVSDDAGQQRITEPAAPWEVPYEDREERREALLEYGQRLLGSRPMDVIDLAVPEAGLRGVGFVLASASAVGRGGHRVYLKRMLLSEDAAKLLPEWAFFVRCMVDTSQLRPTASREALYEDDLLSSVRERLGEQVRAWLLDLSVHHPERLSAFLRVHHLGVKALATRDDEMLRLVDVWLPFETNRGAMPLGVFRKGLSAVRYVETVDEFRALAAIASAAGTPIVNAGYAYDTEILERLPRIEPGLTVRRLDPGELAARLERLTPDQEEASAVFLQAARDVLSELDCEPLMRQFDPVTVPALYVMSHDARTQDMVRRSIETSDELWSDVLSAFVDVEVDPRPKLVFNWRHPLIRRISGYPARPALRHAVEALYGQALLAGHHPLRAADTAALNRSFLAILDQAFAGPEAEMP